MQRKFAWLLLSLITIAGTSILHARPPYKKAMADHFGPLLPKPLNDCRTCHVPAKPGEDDLAEERPHNAFGLRLKALKKELKAAGKDTDIVSRIEAILDEDADGDGVSNLLEILSGHNPGEASDKPTSEELAKAKELAKQFRNRPRVYAWKPFEPVQRPAVPKVQNAGWVKNPIDAFLAVEHEKLGLKPRPEAAKHILVRRVYLDLIGLPPTREELQAFLDDTSPDAFEKAVDRLLASPRYGERWGRHWMDVWRYSDWAGYGAEVRESQPHIWRWRDWIIEALNADKGYDRMVLEMLAGDELAPDDPATVRATGFLVRNWYKFSRNVWLESTVEHTGKAFLGITMNCAKCHDHFFDPISQKEYYQFRAFFEPHDIRTDRVAGQPDATKDGIVRVYDANPKAETHLFVRGNDMNPDKTKSLPPGVPALLGGHAPVEVVKLPLAAHCPEKSDAFVKDLQQATAAEVTKARQALEANRPGAVVMIPFALLHHPVGGSPSLCLVVQRMTKAELEWKLAVAKQESLAAVLRSERLEDAGKKDTDEWKQAATAAGVAQRQQAVLQARRDLLAAQQELRGAAEKARPAVAKKVEAADKALAKSLADEQQPPAPKYTPRAIKSYPAVSTGRRLALARWIVDRQNPLAARVAVNHMWLRHFGQPLVPSVFDFGANGQPATHPALVDWLAVELMENDWSMKKLHRLIVTSSAYRMDSLSDPANAAKDGENRLLWRMTSRRMEAEVVRDSFLHLSGQLDLTMGGPEIDHNQGLASKRRSIYFRHAPEKQVEFLKIFDAANMVECYRRSESVIPQQALALANSSLALAQARLLAAKLTKEAGEDADRHALFIKLGFETVLDRPPSPAEQAECEKFLAEQATLLANKTPLTTFVGGAAASVPPSPLPHLRAREDLIQVLLNHNEFVTIR